MNPARDRAAARAQFDDKTRLTLVEGDIDDLSAALQIGLTDLRDAIADGLEEGRKEVHAMQRVMIGMLVSLTTAIILIAINIVVSR